MKLKNPIIAKINLSEDKMKELTILLKPKMMEKRRHDLIKKYADGLCCDCLGIPTKIVSYDVSDSEQSARKIEKYCDECFEKIRDRDRDKVQLTLTATNGIDETIAVRG